MSCFELCEKCRFEYENPADRRFHAEPNACPVCGPQLKLLDAAGNLVATDDSIRTAIGLLSSGNILAIKGLGGFHLSVDAGSDDAVKNYARANIARKNLWPLWQAILTRQNKLLK